MATKILPGDSPFAGPSVDCLNRVTTFPTTRLKGAKE